MIAGILITLAWCFIGYLIIGAMKDDGEDFDRLDIIIMLIWPLPLIMTVCVRASEAKRRRR